jgi:glycosyltransferase involved in cell wall biosynthesis
MKIAFYNHGIPFNGDTPSRQPLGGSESSIVYMARELARCGHAVEVYANCPEPGLYGHVQYRHYHDFFSSYVSAPWDVVISFRSFDPFLIGRVAPRTVYWTGDAFNQPALENFEHLSLQENIDLVFCVSNWHRDSFIRSFGLPSEKVIATRNGFCKDLVITSPNRDRLRAAYSSTPFRGLDILLEVFPGIRSSFPDFKLDVFSSMKVYGWDSSTDHEKFGNLYAAAERAGVTLHGSIAQPLLMKHLGDTGLFLYPNTFDETSCIAAIEAQASGCVPVTSARAGLKETVDNGKTGICIPGDPKSGEYRRKFTEAVLGLLYNPARLHAMSEAAQKRAFGLYSWETIAHEWTSIFSMMPPRPVAGRWTGPLSLLQKTHDYLQKGNVSAATQVLRALDETPFLQKEVETLKGRLNTWM